MPHLAALASLKIHFEILLYTYRVFHGTDPNAS